MTCIEEWRGNYQAKTTPCTDCNMETCRQVDSSSRHEGYPTASSKKFEARHAWLSHIFRFLTGKRGGLEYLDFFLKKKLDGYLSSISLSAHWLPVFDCSYLYKRTWARSLLPASGWLGWLNWAWFECNYKCLVIVFDDSLQCCIHLFGSLIGQTACATACHKLE